jgi:hypothetical protein
MACAGTTDDVCGSCDAGAKNDEVSATEGAVGRRQKAMPGVGLRGSAAKTERRYLVSILKRRRLSDPTRRLPSRNTVVPRPKLTQWNGAESMRAWHPSGWRRKLLSLAQLAGRPSTGRCSQQREDQLVPRRSLVGLAVRGSAPKRATTGGRDWQQNKSKTTPSLGPLPRRQRAKPKICPSP